MTDKEKQVVAKLEIISELSDSNSVKQLAKVQIEYIKTVSRGEIGFNTDEDKSVD